MLREFFAWHYKGIGLGFNQLRHKPFPSFVTVMMVAIAFSLPVFFWSFIENFAGFLENWHRQGHVTIYLQKHIPVAQQADILKRIQNLPDVGEAKLISPEQGLKELNRQKAVKGILEYLPDNPLPAVIVITPSMAAAANNRVELLYNMLKMEPYAEEVNFDLKWLSKLQMFLNMVKRLAQILIVLLSAALSLIIANTLRLSLYAHQKEIRVLKLIGADDPYIMRPFLYAGAWFGLLGGTIAILIVNVILSSLSGWMEQFFNFYQIDFYLHSVTIKQFLQLLMVIIFLGWFAAWCTVKRQLYLLEPGEK